MKQLLTHVPQELHKRLKVYCIENDMTMKEVISLSVTQYLDDADE